VHQELDGPGVIDIGCGLGSLRNQADGPALAARGGQGSRHQGGPFAHSGPLDSSPKNGLARGENVLFAQESRAPVRGRERRDGEGRCLERQGVPSQASSRILEPKRRERAVLGVSQRPALRAT
jgi:hypothetical protein